MTDDTTIETLLRAVLVEIGRLPERIVDEIERRSAGHGMPTRRDVERLVAIARRDFREGFTAKQLLAEAAVAPELASAVEAVVGDALPGDGRTKALGRKLASTQKDAGKPGGTGFLRVGQARNGANRWLAVQGLLPNHAANPATPVESRRTRSDSDNER